MEFQLIHLFERSSVAPAADADMLVSFITSQTDTVEMRGKRGSDFKQTGFYQIRIKPKDSSIELNEILENIHSLLSSAKAKSVGIRDPIINQKSVNSSKYASVSFMFGETHFDIVVAKGGNKGEKFEKDLLIKMDNLVAGIDDSSEAEQAFTALEAIDPEFKLSNVKSVTARTGSTKRSNITSPEESGKIIADIIVKLKNGKDKYISVKNKSGSTIAQLGLSDVFTTDHKINKKSDKWKNIIEPFDLDVSKIEEGLLAAKNKTEVDWDDSQVINKIVQPGSKLFKLFELLWGSNYYYLREKAQGFYAFQVNEKNLSDVILKNLKLTEIRYPFKDRKQITILAESDNMKFKIEIRNPRGKGSVNPTQIQLVLMKSLV